MEGLRERKKRQTREAIAASAMALFSEHGFDAVTVADVARAADVSEKTVFNYFPTKEDLIFARAEEHLLARAEAIRERVPGLPLTRVFEDETMKFLERVEQEGLDEAIAIVRVVQNSAVLRSRLLLAWERESAVLVSAITDDEDDLVAETVVRALLWTHRLVFRAAVRRLLEGEGREKVAADLREQARLAYARLDLGLAGYAA
ncbi:MAG TPA: TetR family transcriptional regulator [Solirubrobacter sp.]|nr:TetR family transcriptional regulator [Solirubrobacter sp.]